MGKSWFIKNNVTSAGTSGTFFLIKPFPIGIYLLHRVLLVHWRYLFEHKRKFLFLYKMTLHTFTEFRVALQVSLSLD